MRCTTDAQVLTFQAPFRLMSPKQVLKKFLGGNMINLNFWGKAAFLGAVGFLLAACGPVIETHYDYLPPENAGGMQCLAGCQKNQNACQRDEAVAKEECRYREERRVEDAYEEAMEKYYFDLALHAEAPDRFAKPTQPTRGYPSYYRCDNQSSQCQSGYNMCYRSCGGAVSERQVCVANCDG